MQMKRLFLSPSTRRLSSIKLSKLNFYSLDESVMLRCSTWSITLLTVSLIDIGEGLCVNFENLFCATTPAYFNLKAASVIFYKWSFGVSV